VGDEVKITLEIEMGRKVAEKPTGAAAPRSAVGASKNTK